MQLMINIFFICLCQWTSFFVFVKMFPCGFTLILFGIFSKGKHTNLIILVGGGCLFCFFSIF